MKRNIEKYAELGEEKITKATMYDLSPEETFKAFQIYNNGIEKHGNVFDAIVKVAVYFYYAGLEAGSRYEHNRK